MSGRNIGFYTSLLVVVFSIIVSTLVSARSTERSRADQRQLLSFISKQFSERLNENIQDRYADLQTLAVLDVVRDPKASAIKKREILTTLKSQYDSYAWIGLTDKNGKVLASSQGLLEGVDVSQRPWFKESLSRSWIGDLHEAKLLAKLLPQKEGEPLRFVDVTARLRDEKGQYSGVIGAHLSWYWTRQVSDQLLSSLPPEDQISLLVFSSEGKVILNSSKKDVLNETQLAEIFAASRRDEKNNILNNNYIFGSSPIGVIHGMDLGWKIVALQPTVTAFKAATKLQNEILLAGAILGILFASFSFFISDKFESRIILAREKAELMTEAKTKFLAEMSHEIRTPLNGVIGMARILSDTSLNPQQKEYTNHILTSGESLLHIINDILDVSKIEAGKLEVSVAPFALGSMIRHTLFPSTLVAKQKNIELTTELVGVDETTYVSGDAKRIAQVLLNFASNAVKFTEFGSVHVKVEKRDSYRYRFSVTDTGIGIKEENLNRLFQDYAQVHDHSEGKFGGTGLGLSVSRQLVKLMGGEVGVNSTFGQGSTFWFELPLMPAERTPLQEGMKSTKTPTPGARILVIDDSNINLVIAVNALTKAGYSPLQATNGQEALSMLKTEKVDLVLTDCQMPIMNGYEFTQKIRNHENLELRSLPVLAITAGVTQEQQERCIAAGMNDFVEKPFQFKVLIEKIETWMSETKKNS